MPRHILCFLCIFSVISPELSPANKIFLLQLFPDDSLCCLYVTHFTFSLRVRRLRPSDERKNLQLSIGCATCSHLSMCRKKERNFYVNSKWKARCFRGRKINVKERKQKKSNKNGGKCCDWEFSNSNILDTDSTRFLIRLNSLNSVPMNSLNCRSIHP